jgi:hypothetical protein
VNWTELLVESGVFREDNTVGECKDESSSFLSCSFLFLCFGVR